MRRLVLLAALALASGVLTAVPANAESRPPRAVTAYGPLLDLQPTLRWALPSDNDLAGTRITRTAAGAATVTVDVPVPATTYVDPSTVLGTDYTYSFAAVDQDGNVGPSSAVQMTATSARLGVPRPTTTVSTSSRFPVTFPASANAKVWWLDKAGGSFVPWDVPTSGSHVFGREGGTSTQQGHTYAFRFQVFDSHGNASLPHTFQTAVPRDDNWFTRYGQYIEVNSPTFYGGHAAVIRPGSYVGFSARAVMHVIGTTCPTCGVMAIHGEGRVLRFDTWSATRHDRVVLATFALPVSPSHAYVISPEPSGSHRDVVLD
ncbi:MAG: hypothetical protein ABR549_13020, partial [Mycobacteriales bacterium]